MDGFGGLVAGDLVAVDVELGEDQLVHGDLQLGAVCGVEGLGVAEQFDGGEEEPAAVLEPVGGVGELFGDLCAFGLDRVELGLDLGLGPARFADQLQVMVFLGVEFGLSAREALLEGLDAAQAGDERVVEFTAHLVTEVVVQANGRVVAFDGGFELFDALIRLVAVVALPAPADEVEVDPAVAASAHDDEAASAAVAPQQALEVVLVGALPDAASSQRQDPLDPVEQRWRNQGGVAACVLLPVVDDLAGVVGVGQDLVELVERQWPR